MNGNDQKTSQFVILAGFEWLPNAVDFLWGLVDVSKNSVIKKINKLNTLIQQNRLKLWDGNPPEQQSEKRQDDHKLVNVKIVK